MKRRAISVTELLVVIAILMIMTSLLFPVYSRSKDAAKGTVCISNLKQLYVALELYHGDYGAYPWQSFNSRELKPYVGPTELRCPVTASLARQSPRGDYYNYSEVNPLARFGSGAPYFSAYRECRERRQGSFPIITDENRTTPEFGRAHGIRFVILARQNGSIRKVPVLDGYLSDIPCNGILNFLNL